MRPDRARPQPPPLSRPRLSPWLLIASAMHGVLGVSVWSRSELPASWPPAQSDAVDLFELDLEEVADVPQRPRAVAASALLTGTGSPAPGRVSSQPATAPLLAKRLGPGDSADLGSTSAAGSVTEGVVDGVPSDASPPAEGDAPSREAGPSLSLSALGVGSSNVFLAPDRPAPAGEAAERRLETSMQTEILQADQQRGLGRGGPIVTALRSAVYASDTPPNGRAELLGVIDSGGRVTRLDVLSVSSEHPRWREIARRALAALSDKHLRTAPRGLSVRLEVVSRVQLPSGHDPGLGVSIAGIPVKEGDGKHSTSIDILKPRAGVEMVDVPDPGGGDPLRLPILKYGITLFGVGGDPADIGAVPQRIVHVRVLEEKAL
jgi:hypothetical protein